MARYQLHVLMLYNGRDTDPSIGTSGLSGSECSDMRHVTAVTVQKRSKPVVFFLQFGEGDESTRMKHNYDKLHTLDILIDLIDLISTCLNL